MYVPIAKILAMWDNIAYKICSNFLVDLSCKDLGFYGLVDDAWELNKSPCAHEHAIQADQMPRLN